jgi:bacillithiol biosynthesis cysteine-adding enzyme BshC
MAKSLVPDYLQGKLRALHPWPAQVEAVPAAAQAKLAHYPASHRETLVRVLRAQYERQGLVAPPSLDRLADAHTVTLTTGQQPGLLGGPLYTLHKAAAVVSLCHYLNAEDKHGLRYVPLFWIAGEDHDAAEINQARVDETTLLQYGAALQGAVGRNVLAEPLTLPQGISPQVARHWQPGRRWNDAFQHMLADWFAGTELLVLNPDEPELKRLFAPVLQQELTHRPTAPLVNAAGDALRKQGYKVQLHASDVCLFYLTDTERLKLEPSPDGGLDTAMHFVRPISEWLDEAREHPDRFSPNAALRPIYQETILPNAAYVGGAGEVAYWLQLQDAFHHFGVPYPVVLQRPSVLLVDDAMEQAANALGLTLDQLLAPQTQLFRTVAEREGLWPATQMEWQEVQTGLGELHRKLADISPTLGRSVQSLQTDIERRKQRLERRTLQQLVQTRPRPFQEALRLRARLLGARGEPQERHYSVLAFSQTPEYIVQQVLAQLDPLKMGLQIIRL